MKSDIICCEFCKDKYGNPLKMKKIYMGKNMGKWRCHKCNRLSVNLKDF